MNNGRNIEQPSSFSMADIYFVVFRHKWKIAILTGLGLVAGAVYYFTKPPPFQSVAELMVRYVADQRSVKPSDNGARVTSVVDPGQSVMKDEMRIITSYDLAATVATNVGPAKILALLGGGNDQMSAASVIQSGLKVDAAPESSVIHITFSHPDQTVVRPVVAAIIDAYYDKHKMVHSSIGMPDEVLADNASQLRSRISETDEELRIAKTNAGILDLADSQKFYSEENSRLRRDLSQAEADLAEFQVSMADLTSFTNSRQKSTNTASVVAIPADQSAKYKATSSRIAFLEKKRSDYFALQGFTEENKMVKEVTDQLANATKLKADLEEKYPGLADMVFSPIGTDTEVSKSASDSKRISALRSKIIILIAQLNKNQAEAAKLGEVASKISALEQTKQGQEDTYKYYQKTLDQKRIDESLGTGRDDNVKPIQSPSPPYKDFKKFYKNVFSLFFGGLVAGLAWACLIEFFLDRSIKRPGEIQNKLKIPFFLSIPDLSASGSKRSTSASRQLAYNAANGGSSGKKTGSLEVMAWDTNRRFNSYYDALRDRLVVYFEAINLTRKPKLVAITSTHRGSGVSTIAAGLAASLSETGDGRVLLVDMNHENGAAQQFFRGEATFKLDDALASDKRESAMVQDNLYVVTEDTISDKLPRALPRRFASLIPKLKASDYDYIIFDMPPVSPTSVTSRLAGFMDTVMLVIESEKTDQQVVQQANALLAQSKANVTAVLNKTKHYIPARLHQDFLSDT
jgi:uncharacterized protein involved in exopolysaccharide biosynthesis/Mrp family chromosome partitioning ATPase